MDINTRIKAFEDLARILVDYTSGTLQHGRYQVLLDESLDKASAANGWFRRSQVVPALAHLAAMMAGGQLQRMMAQYPGAAKNSITPKKIAVIMAGNIPLAGFHDFLCVLLSGNIFHGKLSASDPYLLPAIAQLLTDIEPAFDNRISFTNGQIGTFDAVIATGSNNSARYFEQYFGGYPCIIRHNRNSAAIITGNETPEELNGLADDIFMYYGLGCRSVSFLFLPAEYELQQFYDAMLPYSDVKNHHKYFNNYTYNRSLYLMDSVPFYDNGFLLLRPYSQPASPVAVVHYMEYENMSQVRAFLEQHKQSLQCVVGNTSGIENLVPFGKAQQPALLDYADGVDTIEFLSGLNNI